MFQRSASRSSHVRNAASSASADRIGAELRREIVRGRAALARAPSQSPDAQTRADNEPAIGLLRLLWHSEMEVRRAAACALRGGDHVQAHVGEYGHFVGAFLRGLDDLDARSPNILPAGDHERRARVETVLGGMLDQSIGEIRGLSSMNYSFLSSALYLAVLATCRDVVLAIGRLRAASAQAELCRLLWNLAQMSVQKRVNGQDLESLASATGQALAALPPDAIPDFWRSLAHDSLPRRAAVAPALLHFEDNRAVPYLLEALTLPVAPPSPLAQQIAACLGRIGDARALPVLTPLAASRDRALRGQARAAIALIERQTRGQPAQTLLRPVGEDSDNGQWDYETMLRSAPVNTHESEPPREMLRATDLPRAASECE